MSINVPYTHCNAEGDTSEKLTLRLNVYIVVEKSEVVVVLLLFCFVFLQVTPENNDWENQASLHLLWYVLIKC